VLCCNPCAASDARWPPNALRGNFKVPVGFAVREKVLIVFPPFFWGNIALHIMLLIRGFVGGAGQKGENCFKKPFVDLKKGG